MQDKKTEKKKAAHDSKKNDSNRITDKLMSKLLPADKERALARLRYIIRAAAYIFFSWILSAGQLPFGVRPLSLALLCATQTLPVPVFLGILLAVIGGRATTPMLWGALVILVFRIVVSFVPDFHENKGDTHKGSDINLDSLGDDISISVPRLSGKTSRKKQNKTVLRRAVSLAEKLLCISSNELEDITPRASRENAKVTDKKSPRTENTRVGRYNETLGARALFASVGGFVCGLFTLIDGEYAFYNMIGALITISVLPLLTAAFYPLDSKHPNSWQGTLSRLLLICAVTWSCGKASLLGIPVAPLAVMLFTLITSSLRGTVVGAACGLLLGVIYDPLYAPLLCLCTILYSLISPFKKSVALGTAALCVVLWCYYFGGASGLVGTLTPMLVSLPLFFVADKYYTVIFPERAAAKRDSTQRTFSGRTKIPDGIYFAEAISQRGKNEIMTDKLGALSEAFSSMSETFNGLVDRFRRPDILGIRKISDSILEHTCADCRNHDVCWGVGYSDTIDISGRITSCLHLKGKVEPSDLPESFFASCPRAERLIREANKQCESATESLMREQKIGIFASNFDDISAILRDALDCESDEYECDMEASEKIFNMLSDAEYKVRGVVVCGKRNKRVLIKGASASESSPSFSSGELCSKFSAIVGTPLMGPIFEMSQDETVMTFYSKPRLSAVCSHGRIAALSDKDGTLANNSAASLSDVPSDDTIKLYRDDDLACGDCTRVFVNGNSYFYSLISDGMGSGSEAALASEISSMFVEKMLMAGNRADITVRMLNNFLRSENIGLGRECSATLDLFELDLMNGNASFIKSGAAPTYICRDKTVYKVNSRTMPVGIIKQADAKLTKFDTRPSDIVVMISDGCCPDSDDCPWLVEYLSDISMPPDRSPEHLEEFTSGLKNNILSLAVENSPKDKHKDDISVSVVLISA